MKRLILSLAVITMAATACKKGINDKTFSDRGAVAGNYDAIITLPTVIDADMELTNNNLYLLDGKCYVTNGATMVVQEGTRIEAVKQLTPDAASALVITRGSKLFAQGTSENPIVFTSHETTPASGDWGGIVILGNAPLNRADATIEGINLPSVPPGVDVNYGGGGAGLGDPHHYGGELVFVRIEYAGATIATDNELNGLTLGGVGDATVLDFIEVAYGNDDAFEFFGGTVNASHLFALVPDDDAFDFDFGYNGHIQFAVSVLDSSQNYSANPNGIETDNDGTGSSNTPLTQAKISNMTVYGLRTNTLADSRGLLNGAHIRRNSSYIIANSIFAGFNNGVRFQAAAPGTYDYNIVHGHDLTVLTDGSGSAPVPNNILIAGGADANDGIGLTDPWNILSPNFVPLAGSLPLTAGTSFSMFPAGHPFDTTPTYRGAFGTVNWLAGWAKYNY
jgi:hypothetical protein